MLMYLLPSPEQGTYLMQTHIIVCAAHITVAAFTLLGCWLCQE